MITRAYIDKFHAISLGQISFRVFFSFFFFYFRSLYLIIKTQIYEVYLTRVGIAVAIGVNLQWRRGFFFKTTKFMLHSLTRAVLVTYT